MGVVNVTPDSFSDGGLWLDADTAVQHGLDLVAPGRRHRRRRRRVHPARRDPHRRRGGAAPRHPGRHRPGRCRAPRCRSTRCGPRSPSGRRRRRRAHQRRLRRAGRRPDDAGRRRRRACRSSSCTGAATPTACRTSRTTTTSSRTSSTSSAHRSRRALSAGVRPEQVVIDPGLGFSKTGEQNWTVLAHLDAFTALGYPCWSRPAASGSSASCWPMRPASCAHRPARGGHAAISTLAAQAGAWCVRVHEPAATADAVRVVARLRAEIDGSEAP